MHFASHAKRISMVVRGESLKDTLSHYLIQRIAVAPNIDVLAQTEVTVLHGDQLLREVTLRDLGTGRVRRLATRWLFVCIGGESQTHWAEAAGVMRDEAACILTGPDLTRDGMQPASWPLDREPYFLETNVAGVFAAGDVRHNAVRRCASAGEGAMAVAFVHLALDGH